MNIGFKKTYYGKQEEAAVCDALRNGTDYLERARQKLAGLFDTNDVFLTANSSLALDLIFLAYDFPRGSEVIMPSFTYPSAANSTLRRGLVPVFCDIDPETLVIDIDDAKKKVTKKTVCVVPTHYGGASCDMDRVKSEFAGIMIIEDAALSIGATYKGHPLGTLGDAAILSFHKTKNVSSDEGGSIILNDTGVLKKLRTMYDYGTDRQAFLRGEVPFYSWQDAGINTKMSNLSAAVLCAQLDKLDEITKKQTAIFDAYMYNLRPIADKYGFSLPCIPTYNKNNAHVFYIVFTDQKQKQDVKAALDKAGIEAVIHYVPLHQSNMGKKLGHVPEDLPNTLNISRCMLRLPMHAGMDPKDCERIADEIGRAL